ncbi:hypothetical protein CH373_17825 [Leptospira perolatii]|uniref:Uncharacterized protein n=1 Tax=Leptospira perolatii TaxID=2023191 RepID=A0A2M9ZI83_9LEPT|nr:hypothetical protein [Leptospira perolatii]PJZ68230.1 hypothetical protein CH360_17400 [Leptospira perolatii]PJZ71777.1 hypothetical protein CH373_17825 [Leptospira perolatii]
MSRSIEYSVKDELYQPTLDWDKKGIGMLTGKEGIYNLALLWEYNFAASGLIVFNLDCAIRFNPFVLTEQARRRNIPPEPLLEQIIVRRAFTPYQILDSVQDISKNKWDGNTIYFFLAPCKQFFDPDVREDEGKFLLNKLFILLDDLHSLNYPILIVESLNYSHPTFRLLFPKLAEITSDLWELRVEKGYAYLKTRKTSSQQISPTMGFLGDF